MIGGRKIRGRRKPLFIPVSQFASFCDIAAPKTTITKGAIISGTEIGLLADADDSSLVNNTIAATRTGITGVQAPDHFTAGVTAVVFKNCGGADLIVADFAATSPGVRHLMAMYGLDWDLDEDIYVYALWGSGSNVDTQVVTWRFLYNQYNIGLLDGTLVGDAIIASTPTTALDTAIAEDASAGANSIQKLQLSPRGVINKGSLSWDKDMLHFALGVSAMTHAADCVLYGVLFEYVPYLGRGVKN